MDTPSIILLVSIVLLICCSAFFSATETAFSALNLIRLKNKAENGNQRAALTLRLAEDYDKLLSTILIGNNIVNIAAASLGTVFFVFFFPHYGATISTVVLTVVVLMFGEVSPKSLAKERP
ncbi:MAG: CNNM domain-containing protein, partial [Oscillospiraceae bacterium]